MYARNLAKKAQENPTRITEEEFSSCIDEAREDIRQGKGVRMLPNESLDDFLKRLAYPDLEAAEQDIANGKGLRVSSKQELDALFT